MLHASTHPLQAHGRSPRTALAPIPECEGKPDWGRGPAPSASDLRRETMTTAMQREITADERAAKCAAKCAAVKRKLPAWRSVQEWPDHREAFGRMTLRASGDPRAGGTRAVCRIRDGVLTIGIKQKAAAGDTTEEVAAEVPLEVLAVGLQRGRTNMLTLATVYKNEMFDEIYCFCNDATRRNRWIAVFRQMGVAIYDLID